MDVDFQWRKAIDQNELEALHAVAFDREPGEHRWTEQLSHSLGWATATSGHRLIGFVNVAWDGGSHAFIIDTVVSPEYQRMGVGRRLVRTAVQEARTAGCEWVHVDFEPDLGAFYLDACGFTRTDAGLVRL